MSARIKCAIYTRKSSEEGLEQSFNSLDAQREACDAYIRSQKHEGWIGLSARYDDGGFSGGNMDRPALKKLMDDIANGKVNNRLSEPSMCYLLSFRRLAVLFFLNFLPLVCQ